MKAIQLAIPEPCNERWSGMRPAGENKMHCGSCDKVLVDFSSMSDTELALWFVHSRGKVCGRFSQDQLNRKISIPADKPKKKYWLNALWLIPMSFFAKPSAAQNATPEVIKSKPPVSVNTGQQDQAPAQQETATEIKSKFSGTVVDGMTDKPLADADVFLYDAAGKIHAQTKTDSAGKYSVKFPPDIKESELVISVQKADYAVVQFTCNAAGNEQTALFPEKAFIKMGIVIRNED